MLTFEPLHPQAALAHRGYIPSFLSENDPRPAREQISDNYIGGWFSFKDFVLQSDGLALKYPGDPALLPLWQAELRDETIVVYQHAWVMIKQKDGSFEVARLD